MYVLCVEYPSLLQDMCLETGLVWLCSLLHGYLLSPYVFMIFIDVFMLPFDFSMLRVLLCVLDFLYFFFPIPTLPCEDKREIGR